MARSKIRPLPPRVVEKLAKRRERKALEAERRATKLSYRREVVLSQRNSKEPSEAHSSSSGDDDANATFEEQPSVNDSSNEGQKKNKYNIISSDDEYEPQPDPTVNDSSNEEEKNDNYNIIRSDEEYEPPPDAVGIGSEQALSDSPKASASYRYTRNGTKYAAAPSKLPETALNAQAPKFPSKKVRKSAKKAWDAAKMALGTARLQRPKVDHEFVERLRADTEMKRAAYLAMIKPNPNKKPPPEPEPRLSLQDPILETSAQQEPVVRRRNKTRAARPAQMLELHTKNDAELYCEPWIGRQCLSIAEGSKTWTLFNRDGDVADSLGPQPEFSLHAITKITSSLQALLEKSAFAYTAQHNAPYMAKMGSEHGLELHRWLEYIRPTTKDSSWLSIGLCRDPEKLIHGKDNAIFNNQKWRKVLKCAAHVRHTATHRLKSNTETLLECIGAAGHVLDALQDRPAFQIANKLHILIATTQTEMEDEVLALRRFSERAREDQAGEEDLVDLDIAVADVNYIICKRLIQQVESLFARPNQFQSAGIVC